MAKSSVLRSASIVGVMTAFSRVLGLVREVAMGYLFGTSALKSSFDIAFTIPNLFRRLFGEGALSSAFIPIFSETLEREGRDSAWRIASNVLLTLSFVLAVMTAGGILLTFPLAESLDPASRWLAPLPMLRILLPYSLFICLAAILSGMLNCFGKFAISSFTPFLLNFFWLLVLGVLILFPGIFSTDENRLLFLCFGVLLAGVAQLLFQVPALRRQGFRLHFSRVKNLFHDERLRKVLYLMGPAAVGMGLIQINVCLDKLLAFWADRSAPAALEYAERITYLPLGMFATAFMTVLLPTFSRQVSQSRLEDLRDTMEQSVRTLGMVMIPSALALFVLAEPVIHAIYAYRGGQFTSESVTLCARALAAYAPGLVIFSLQKIFTPAFYALQEIKTPVRVSLWCLILNFSLNVTSVILLPQGWKHCGIAGSTVLSSVVNSLILFVLLQRRIPSLRLAKMVPSLLRSLLAACGMVAVAWLLWTRGSLLLGVLNKGKEWALLGTVIGFSIVVYGMILFVINREEMMAVVSEVLHRRARKEGKDGE